MKALSVGFSSCFLLLALGCGGGPETEGARSADDADSESTGGERRSAMGASAEIGALDSAAVTRTFEGALGGLEKCLKSGASRVELLGGQIAFYVEVDTSGHAGHVHAERRTLGDRETERCMLGVLKGSDWPPPQGGDKGLARNSFDFDMPNDVRPPVEWESENVREALGEVSSRLTECKNGARGDITATVYVDTEGNAIAAGVAGTDPSLESAADCLSGVLKEAKYPSPGSWPAKVTFDL